MKSLLKEREKKPQNPQNDQNPSLGSCNSMQPVPQVRQESETPLLDLVRPPDLHPREIDPNRDGPALDSACPVQEGTMGVFDVPRGQTCHITSANFLSCVGLVLEAVHAEGKRVGFVHINELETEHRPSDIRRLIGETGKRGGKVGAQVFFGTGNKGEDTTNILEILVPLLQQSGVTVQGVMPPTDNERSKDNHGNLLATASLVSVSEQGDVSVATSNDPAVHGPIADREQRFHDQAPWFASYDLEGERLGKAYEQALQAADKEQDPQRKEKLAEEAERLMKAFTELGNCPYPMVWNPEGGQDTFTGNAWKG